MLIETQREHLEREQTSWRTRGLCGMARRQKEEALPTL